MPGDYFWQCVQALAVTFDGDMTTAEENLTVYEMHAQQFTPERRGGAPRYGLCDWRVVAARNSPCRIRRRSSGLGCLIYLRGIFVGGLSLRTGAL